MIKKILLRTLLVLATIFVAGLLIPQNLQMPVVGADDNSYNHETFWYEGWGTLSIRICNADALSNSIYNALI